MKESKNRHVRKLMYDSFGMYGVTGYKDEFTEEKQRKAKRDRLALWGY